MPTLRELICSAALGRRKSPEGSYTLDSNTTQQTSALERIRILVDLQTMNTGCLGRPRVLGVVNTNTTRRPAA
jgi:hypothetical protein